MTTREEKVINFLKSNPQFLEDYVIGPNVSKAMFHNWALKRDQNNQATSHKKATTGIFNPLIHQIFIAENAGNTAIMLYEIASACAQLISVNRFDVLIRNEEGPFFIVRNKNSVMLKKTTKARKPAISSIKLTDCSGTTLGKYRFKYRFSQSIFQDIVSMDAVIMKVMNFAQKLTNADRASLFLVDHKTNELYARIFDVGTDNKEDVVLDEHGHKEIRFPFGKGIAGYVASTGKGLNIQNAYDDDRFNNEIDLKTGYKTQTILCMPIFIRGTVIGVVQMVNKANGPFTKQDERAFETFAVYCALALHHAKLYDKIKRSEKKYRVALEVLTYHSTCTREEVEKLNSLKMEIKDRIVEIETIDIDVRQLSDMKKPLYAIYMFQDLFDGIVRFDHDDLVRFVLTVRKNYRNVAYHNWEHGWTVAHAMYLILKVTNIFDALESLGLYVACLCHDLDHRGRNNAYMKSMSAPLAAMYSTSVMEHHHFNQTVTILQQDGHNIFKSLSSREYKMVLKLIKHCILATDLALFFVNKAKMKVIIDQTEFDWNIPDHRSLMESIIMTGCDLIASAKPWSVQTEIVKVIFQEFYEQGDAERESGKEPIAMMDRNRAHELPKMQVEFMTGICIPCYEIISKVVPESAVLFERCWHNSKKWKEIADEQNALSSEH
ncbi:unnamed protein product [Dracunculus medinensis]|uniref:Phosphodiesterase n=1 Tax=Dracunculus medinensis TaxID=318479 RepID=A0A158Q616_DRAME|nr:unnamed protein product [Dracunculus medinensis]